MSDVSVGFYSAVLQRITAPVNTENLRACHAWQHAEGGLAKNNPWNTTQAMPNATWYNSFGSSGQYHVLNYPTEESGIEATVKTLNNGHYATIVAAFRVGNNGLAVCKAVDYSVWGTHLAERSYTGMYGGGTIARRVLRVTSPLMYGSDVRQVQEKLINLGFHCGASGADSYYGNGTAGAVRAFETAKHLSPVDGVVGSQVYHSLGFS